MGSSFRQSDSKPERAPALSFPLLSYLNSPELVVSIQRAFGVEYCEKGESHYAENDNNDNHATQSRATGQNVKKRARRRGPALTTEETSSEEDEDKPASHARVTNRFWFVLFHIGAGLGNEIFYIAFFPWWFWNVDSASARRMVLAWVVIMYIGQAAKDLVCWPRPASPPVVRLEKRYEEEYGMPSTHAMIAIAFPWSLIVSTAARYDYPLVPAIICAILWCSLICTSRLYLGMHSVLDVIVGLVFSALLIGGALPLFDAIDQLQLTHPWSPYASFFIGLLLCLAYPTLQKWNTARGDTTIIVGVAAGVSVGSWLAFQHGMLVDPHQPRPYPVVWPTALQHGLSLIRMGVGIVIIWATRAVFKVLTFNLASRLWGFDPHDRATKKKIQVELPHKYLTYYAIAFNVIYVCPTVFRYLGVSRDVTFTEL